MNQIQAMRVFMCVAEGGSFRCAAREFHVSNALVTRAIALLEKHLQTRLFARTTRTVSLTDAGARYLEGCRALLEELDHLELAVTRTGFEPGGALRVVASSELSPLTVTRLMSEFREAHPAVTIRLTLTSGHVDLIENGYDVGIITGVTQSKALVERPLGADPLIPVATPAYLAARGRPTLPIDLQLLPFIGLKDDGRRAAFRFRHRGGSTEQVMLYPVYSVNDGSLVRAATLSKMGFSILPRGLMQADLENGTLVRLLPDYAIDEPVAKISIVYPARQNLPHRTRAFIDFASAKLSHEFAVDTHYSEELLSLVMQHQARQGNGNPAHAL